MMKLKLLALLLAGGVTYQVVLKDSGEDSNTAELGSVAAQQAFTSGGFMPIAATIQTGNGILIFTPINCPEEESQRALRLQSELKLKGLNVELTNNIGASFDAQSSTELQEKMTQHSMRMEMLLAQAGPYVFIRNEGKANPTLDEIVTAYRAY